MAQRLGADVAALDAAAADFTRVGDALEISRQEVTYLVSSVVWVGLDADEFRATWSRRLAPLLDGAASFLRDLAQHLRMEADQQRGASASLGAALGGLGGGGSPEFSHGGGGGPDVWSILGEIGHVTHIAGMVSEFLMDPFKHGIGETMIGLVNDFPELRSVLPAVAKYAEPVGYLLGLLAAGCNAVQFVSNLNRYGFTAVPTLESGLDTVADGVSMIPNPFGLVGSAGIHLGEFVYNLDPNWPTDAAHGWSVVSTDVKNTLTDVWNTSTTDIKNTVVNTWDSTTTGIKDFAGGAIHDLTSWIP
jgi:hypothetical protein